MYEAVTYEGIVKRLLDRVPADMDKREGSVIYDAVAPVAVELQNMYIELDWMLEQAFADTAARANLVRRCAEWGIAPYPAKRAVLKGEFDQDVEPGTRFSLETLNYIVLDKMSEGIFRMECETAGTVGNTKLGSLIPVYYIQGLKKAQLTELLESGIDEEPTKALRERFLVKARRPSTSGNRYDYYNWAMECAGVGAAKVFPLASGPGTVKVVIADADRQAAPASLVGDVSDHIEELRPIGATVTVVSAKELKINVSASVRLKNGINLGQAQEEYARAVAEYLKDNAFDTSYISIARMGSLLLDIPGIEDLGNLLLNGLAQNVVLSDEEIAVTGTVVLEVM